VGTGEQLAELGDALRPHDVLVKPEPTPACSLDEPLKPGRCVRALEEVLEVVERGLALRPEREVHEYPALDEHPVLEPRVAHEEPLQLDPAAGERRVRVVGDAVDPEEQEEAKPARAVHEALRSLDALGQQGVGVLHGADFVQRELREGHPWGQERKPCRLVLRHRAHR